MVREFTDRRPSNPPRHLQMLIRGVCLRKRAVVSTVTTVHPSKPLENFLFGLRCPSEGCLGGPGGLLHKIFLPYMQPISSTSNTIYLFL